MFKIDIVDNIKLSLDLTIDSFEQILMNNENNDDAKSYKLAIINLHSAFELTFKFMILNRNEFMIFSFGSNGFNDVLNKYKLLENSNCNSLLHYFEVNPSEKQPNTVSFKIAYQILAYMYKVPEFNERFIFQLIALENLRNKLTHFEAIIAKVDFILLISLFEKCLGLFNSEIDEYNNSIRPKQSYATYDKYNWDKKCSYREIGMKLVKDKILNEQKFKLILGVVLDELNGEMLELKPDEYDKFAEICYKKRKVEFESLFSTKKEKEIKSKMIPDIYILLEADLIEYGDVYVHEVAVLGRTTLTSFAINVIKEKWNDNSDICRELVLKDETDIDATFNYIQNIEQDQEEDFDY